MNCLLSYNGANCAGNSALGTLNILAPSREPAREPSQTETETAAAPTPKPAQATFRSEADTLLSVLNPPFPLLASGSNLLWRGFSLMPAKVSVFLNVEGGLHLSSPVTVWQVCPQPDCCKNCSAEYCSKVSVDCFFLSDANLGSWKSKFFGVKALRNQCSEGLSNPYCFKRVIDELKLTDRYAF
jgi:hypothetical protein